jgi:hypothetical protein
LKKGTTTVTNDETKEEKAFRMLKCICDLAHDNIIDFLGDPDYEAQPVTITVMRAVMNAIDDYIDPLGRSSPLFRLEEPPRGKPKLRLVDSTIPF